MLKSLSPLLAVVALAGALSLGACNTVAGAGEDMQQAGEAVEDTADDANPGTPQ